MPHFENYSEENYLKAIYKLSQKEEKLNNIGLAKYLQLNPATVLEMIRKMTAKKLVSLRPDKSIHLTDKGKKMALLVIRRHRLWEVFLVSKLKYQWNEVHEMAEQLEHIASDSLVDRLEAFLEFPAFDPHGDPIPDKQGRIRSNVSIPLANCEEGKTYEVVNLAETSDLFLEYLDQRNIRPGSKIKILKKIPFDHSLNIMVARKPYQLGEKASRNILVRPDKD